MQLLLGTRYEAPGLSHVARLRLVPSVVLLPVSMLRDMTSACLVEPYDLT